jgi:hypothetical protein
VARLLNESGHCPQVITEDLNDLLSKVVDPATADFAVVTGIQIHAGTSEVSRELKLV